MIRGSCLCTGVRFELRSAPQLMNHCHCSMCRKHTGAAFGTFLHGKASDFRWVAGEALVTRYASSPGNERAFCSLCGSTLPVIEAPDDHVCIPAGSLDDDPVIRPSVQFFTGSKAPWHELAPDPVQFEKFPPDTFFEDV
jgi:hypothetical protein